MSSGFSSVAIVCGLNVTGTVPLCICCICLHKNIMCQCVTFSQLKIMYSSTPLLCTREEYRSVPWFTGFL